VPLLVPEVNGAHLVVLPRARGRGLVITNPNCTATGLVLALAPVRQLLRPRAIHVSTYQSISGAGFPGVPALSVADNVLPFIAGEEEKVAEESAWILGTPDQRVVRPARMAVMAHCARVGTREGHLEAVTIEATRRPALAEIVDCWKRFDPLRAERLPTAPSPPLELRSERDRPQPLSDRWAGRPARARGMAVVIGRVRWTPPFLRLFLLSHNAVRGGAGGSVLNSEFALRHGVLAGLVPPGDP
jgi:aspartate-semialdehyde dehydrogenase